MNGYTVEKLQEKLDKNLSWRKNELTYMKMLVDEQSGENLNTSIRTAILILYAHWEGYIKQSAREYLKFINAQKHRVSELTFNFFVLHYTKTLISAKQSNKKTMFGELFDEIFNFEDEVFKVKQNDSSIVSTESNLNYSVFYEILYSLGLRDDKFQMNNHLINYTLVEARNKIAHGENHIYARLLKEEKEAKETYFLLDSRIIEMMDDFKNEILESATSKKYLKTKPMPMLKNLY